MKWTCDKCGKTATVPEGTTRVYHACRPGTKAPPANPGATVDPGDVCCSPPSLVQKVCNATAAGLKFAAGGFPTLTAEASRARTTVCQGDGTRPPCPFYDAQARTCTDCGCYVELKAAMATEDCPRGFWPK